MRNVKKLGITRGLVRQHGPERPEQVYVYETDNHDRPIVIEGMHGYQVGVRMSLSRSQAKELGAILSGPDLLEVTIVLEETDGVAEGLDMDLIDAINTIDGISVHGFKEGWALRVTEEEAGCV